MALAGTGIVITGAVVGGILLAHGAEDRVKGARERVGDKVRDSVTNAGLQFPPRQMYFRAFKAEKELEIWGSDFPGKPFKLIQKYPIVRMSGELGPKRKEGDLQVPEGLYHIDRFNPKSQFHLSLGINYPNASDRVRSDSQRPGGDIFIHGSDKSIGCLAMSDEKIEEIYVLALTAKSAGLTKIPVHIFPFRMSPENIRRRGRSLPALAGFWEELTPFYDSFEHTRLLANFKVEPTGRYRAK